MNRLDINCLANIYFEINWNCADAAHKEKYLARKANIWRDIFPPEMKQALLGLEKGQGINILYDPGRAVPGRSSSDIIKTNPRTFISREFQGIPIKPVSGRFYPRGMLGGVHFFPQDMRPCRVSSMNGAAMSVDLAHPLADRKLNISATVEDLNQKTCETGGRLSHWMEEILGTGPGMQARVQGRATEFISERSFDRIDGSNDQEFYKNPRLVDHIDTQARAFLSREYAGRLKPEMDVLDIMTSVNSHLPLDFDARVAGLGLNQEEMDANPRLESSIVHDLNQNPVIPFDDGSFDAILCSLSVEYLVRPYDVVREAARILRPGGLFLVGFSNRWFPQKVTRVWQELHEFERVGFVLDMLIQAGEFKDMETVSIRNWWRPDDDPHTDKTWISDPVYLVAGRRN